MRLFVSWSGEYSNHLAEIFADWIKKVEQTVQPFVSSGDIDAGSRWASKLTNELSENDFGVAFITKQNRSAPWILFEAGALSKDIGESRFVPILCGISNIELRNNPIQQFQNVNFDKAGMLKLVLSISKAARGDAFDEPGTKEIFEVWWPKLEEKEKDVLIDEAEETDHDPSSDASILSELKETVSDLVDAVRELRHSYKQDLAVLAVSRDILKAQNRRSFHDIESLISEPEFTNILKHSLFSEASKKEKSSAQLRDLLYGNLKVSKKDQIERLRDLLDKSTNPLEDDQNE